jgi:uncharacterized protein YecE (DUF72 family)
MFAAPCPGYPGAMADRVRGRVRIGCSGWVYKQWRGTVYPESAPERDWFGCYASWFDTVEINNTFYRLPTEAAVRAWAAQAPEGFVYSVKLGSFGTHRKKLLDSSSWLPNHLDRVGLLGRSQGPTLVQLPPRWHRNADRLDEFLDEAASDRRWAVEIRDPSWLHDDVYGVLRRHNAALCIHDLLPGVPWEPTADWAYLRFHGPSASKHPYQGAYGPRRLRPIADQLSSWSSAGLDVYAYFNNDDSGFAVKDARWLAEHVNGGSHG